MFKSARLKLTAWYLLIIMMISFLFSIVIYNSATHELARIERRQHLWSQRMMGDFIRPPGSPEWFEPIETNEIRQRIIFMLFLVNSAILVFSGVAGYFLAGATLNPIKDMVDEQSRFISDASHELRTPLTSLKAAMEVSLRDKNTNLADSKTLISESLAEVNKLQSLTDGLLSLAQYQKPNGNTEVEKLNLQELVKSAVKNIIPKIRQKRIVINNKTADFEIAGNKYSLIELLVILLDNAVKYSPPKSTITLFTKRNDGSILLSVKDEGPGIAQKDLPHIFERFYRADSTRSKSDVTGFGLGLSIAKKIVELHHGTITVESKKEKGSTFSIRLPAKHSS